MKKLTDVIVNDANQDAIISYYSKPERNATGEIHWVNQKDNIAFCTGDPNSVTIYVRDKDNPDRLSSFEIRASSIRKLMELFKDIEAEITQDFID